MDKKDGLIICRCEEVTRQEIEDAIKEDINTVDGIKRRTRSGMGLCQGRTCRRLVSQIIAEKTGKKMGEIAPQTIRPPVRPIKLKSLGEGK